MLTLTHLLILAIVVIVFTGPSRLPNLTKALGEGVRNFKKGMRGEGDIDVTDSVKRIEDDHD